MTERNEAASRHRTALWVGLIGAILAFVAGVFGAHGGSVWGLPNALKARVVQALDAARLPGLDVQMRGQQARIGGIVPDESALALATRAALGAAGPGGAWAGGVTDVDTSDLRVGPMERPYILRVVRGDDEVRLSGAVQSDRVRALLLRTARSAFPNAEIVDEMRVVGGAPSSNWGAMANNVVRALGTLESGEARLINERIAIIGTGSFEAVDAVRRAYAAPAPPFRARVVARVDGLDLTTPQLQGLRLDSDESCQQGFDRVLDGRAITFAENGAEPTPASAAALDAVIAVALRCDSNRLQVVGPAGGGPGLSLQRAQHVAALLAREGVIAPRISASPGAGRTLIVRVRAPT